MPRKKSQKRKRVKRNKDGTLNKKDLAHNVALYKKYMLKDNPWMLQYRKRKSRRKSRRKTRRKTRRKSRRKS